MLSVKEKQLFISILIIICSFLVFLYWFRCTTLLILGQRSCGDYASKVVSIVRLSFPSVQQELQAEVKLRDLDHLYGLLDHDYQILTDLLRHANSQTSIECRFLTIDYKFMKALYKLAKNIDIVSSRKMLEEMSSILCFFAEETGQAAASL